MDVIGPVIVAIVGVGVMFLGEALVYEHLVRLPRGRAYLASGIGNVLAFVFGHAVGELSVLIEFPLTIVLKLSVLLALNWTFERRGRMLLIGALTNLLSPIVGGLVAGVVAAMLIVAGGSAAGTG